jgi:hypothetical protein
MNLGVKAILKERERQISKGLIRITTIDKDTIL